MIITAIGFFALAAILGLFLISYILRSKETPKGVAIVHGILAATGIVLLVIYSLGNSPSPIESLVLFIIAATGGFIVFVRDIINKPVPKWLAIVHGLVAVTGFIFILMFAFNK